MTELLKSNLKVVLLSLCNFNKKAVLLELLISASETQVVNKIN